MNILAAQNQHPNIEIEVSLLGNCFFYKNINQDLAATTTYSSLYQYSHRNYDSICINVNLKSDFHIIEQMMETYPEYTIPLYYKHIFDWRKRPLFTQTIQSYTSQFFLHEFELYQKSEHHEILLN